MAQAPTARTEVAAAAAGGKIYVVGGYLADGATVATVEILDIATGRWEAGPDLPVAVNHAMASTVDGAVYVFGGYLAGNVPSTAAFRLDGRVWRAVPPLPEGRAAGTAVAVDTVVYVAGGIASGGRLAEAMLRFNAGTGEWSTAPGPPTPREHLGGAGFAGLVYTVGGRTGGLSGNLTAFEVFDPSTNAWSRLPDLPTRRGGLAATATCSGLVVAVGGEAAETFAEVEAFDVRTGQWRSLPPLPTPRHGLGVVAVGTVVYTLSGGPHPGLHVADATEALDTAPMGAC
jgi:non-specific serine/threonine protein kinase